MTTERIERMARAGRAKLDAVDKAAKLEREVVESRRRLRWHEGWLHFQKAVAADLGPDLIGFVEWDGEKWEPEVDSHTVAVVIQGYEEIRVLYVNSDSSIYRDDIGPKWRRHYWHDDYRKTFAVVTRRYDPSAHKVVRNDPHHWHHAADMEMALAYAQDAGRRTAEAREQERTFAAERKIADSARMELSIEDLAA